MWRNILTRQVSPNQIRVAAQGLFKRYITRFSKGLRVITPAHFEPKPNVEGMPVATLENIPALRKVMPDMYQAAMEAFQSGRANAEHFKQLPLFVEWEIRQNTSAIMDGDTPIVPHTALKKIQWLEPEEAYQRWQKTLRP